MRLKDIEIGLEDPDFFAFRQKVSEENLFIGC